MTDTPDLLPCPFCGRIVIKTLSDDLFVWHKCDWCHAEGPAEMPDAAPPQGWNIREPQAVAVEVKPLEWKEARDGRSLIAKSPVGFYAITPFDIGNGYRLSISNKNVFTCHPSVDAAKATAEAHHRDLFLSQITTRSVDEVRNATLDEAARAVEAAGEGGCLVGGIIRALKSQPATAPVQDEAAQRLMAAAWAEAQKAMLKYPQPNYVITKVAEEAGEVVKAAVHCTVGRETPENVVSEITQAIAMLLRLYVEGDQVHGLPALAVMEVQK